MLHLECKYLVILGTGGYGRTVADVARQLGYEVIFLDDNSNIAVGKCADFAQYADDNTWFYPAFGNNEGRLYWLRRLSEAGCQIPTLIHPTAYVSPTAKILPGTVVLPRALINTDTVVESGCIINCGAIIDHGCVIEEGCHICLGAVVKGENCIPRCTKIEAGAVIANRTYPV